MYQFEKRHLFGGGTMETKWVIYDVENHRTLDGYYDTKKQAEKALARKSAKKNSRNALRGVRRGWPTGADDGRPGRRTNMDYFYYRYQELRERAVAPNATQEDINELGRWFEAYGSRFWNGESYDMDGGLRLFPIYEKVDEDDCEIIGFEIR